MRSFLEAQIKRVSINDVSRMIDYPQLETLNVGSNERIKLDDSITELEMYLRGLEDGDFVYKENLITRSLKI